MVGPPQEIESFSADVLTVFTGSDQLLLWPIHGQEWQPLGGVYPQYPGTVVASLLLAGVIVARRVRPAEPVSSRWRERLVVSLVAVAGIAIVAGLVSWLAGPWGFAFGPLRLSVSRPYKPVGLGMNLLLVAAMLTPRFAALVRSGSLTGLYATGAIAASLLALGPLGRVFGRRFWYKPPYAWLISLPGFDSARVPALFSAITVLCLAVLAAYSVAYLVSRPTRKSFTIIAMLAAAIVLDGWAIVPATEVPRPIPATIAGDLVVELPRRGLFDDTAAMYRSIEHQRPIVNGDSGYNPPHYGYLIYDLNAYCFDSLDATRGGRSLDVVIWRDAEEASRIDAALLVRWGRSVREEAPDVIVYHVPRAPGLGPAPPVDPSIDLRNFCVATRPR